MVKSRKGPTPALKEAKVPVTSGKEKGQCSKGDQCSFPHESNDRAQKPEHTAATPSEPNASRGRSVSKKRSIQGKSNHGAILRQSRRYYLKVTCTRTSCEYWHPPECQFTKMKRVVTLETSVCSRITRLMNNQINSRQEKTVLKKRRESDDKNAVAIVKTVSQLGCISQDSGCVGFSKRQNSPDAKKVLGPIRRTRFTDSTLRQASIREKKGPSLGKIQVKRPLSAKSLRYEI